VVGVLEDEEERKLGEEGYKQNARGTSGVGGRGLRDWGTVSGGVRRRKKGMGGGGKM